MPRATTASLGHRANGNRAMLEDILAPGLRLVICGTAVGTRSAAVGHYYSGRNNKLWETLHSSGLVPELLTPLEDQRLLEFGIGFTDLVKMKAGMDASLGRNDWDIARFEARVLQYGPTVVCFNGKKAGQI